MKKSIFFRFFLVVLGNTVLAALLIFLFFTHIVRKHELLQTEDNLLRLARVIGPEIISQVEEKKTGFDQRMKEMGKLLNLRLTVIDAEGKVLADSEEMPEKMENHRYRFEFKEALAGGIGRTIRFSDTMHQDMLYLAVPLKTKQTIGVLRLSQYIARINQMLIGVEHQAIAVLAILLLAALVLSLWFSRRLATPIRHLARLSKRVSGGDMSGRMRLTGRDELRELADNFNEMVIRLAQLIQSLTSSQAQLEAVISGINEGLVLIDASEKIVMTNSSFRKICGQDEPEGKLYWEVLRSQEFHAAVQDVKMSQSKGSREMEWNGCTYLVTFACLQPEKSIVALFHDISGI